MTDPFYNFLDKIHYFKQSLSEDKSLHLLMLDQISIAKYIRSVCVDMQNGLYEYEEYPVMEKQIKDVFAILTEKLKDKMKMELCKW